MVAFLSSSYNLDTIDKLPIKYDGLETIAYLHLFIYNYVGTSGSPVSLRLLTTMRKYIGSDLDTVLSSKISALTAGILLTVESPSLPRAASFRCCLFHSPCLSIPEAVTLSPGSLGLLFQKSFPCSYQVKHHLFSPFSASTTFHIEALSTCGP